MSLTGMQKIGRLGRKSIGQIVFRRTVRAWETRVICPIFQAGELFIQMLDSVVSNSPMVG